MFVAILERVFIFYDNRLLNGGSLVYATLSHESIQGRYDVIFEKTALAHIINKFLQSGALYNFGTFHDYYSLQSAFYRFIVQQALLDINWQPLDKAFINLRRVTITLTDDGNAAAFDKPLKLPAIVFFQFVVQRRDLTDKERFAIGRVHDGTVLARVSLLSEPVGRPLRSCCAHDSERQHLTDLIN